MKQSEDYKGLGLFFYLENTIAIMIMRIIFINIIDKKLEHDKIRPAANDNDFHY